MLNDEMVERIRIIKHEAVPQCGSFEVRFPGDRPRQYFYWDDIPARRLRPETLDRATALEKAKAVAWAARGIGTRSSLARGYRRQSSSPPLTWRIGMTAPVFREGWGRFSFRFGRNPRSSSAG